MQQRTANLTFLYEILRQTLCTEQIARAKNLAIAVALWLFSSSAYALAPLPFFSDPAMQTCLLEQAVQNNWQYAEDVEVFSCVNQGAVDTSGLEALPNLKQLDLQNNRLSYIWSIANHTGLTHLNLSGNNTLTGNHDLIFALQNNPGLTHLGLANIKPMFGMSPVDHVGQLNNLIELDISNTSTSNITHLSGLTQLQALNISHNTVQTLDGINAANLTSIDASNTGLANIYAISGLTGLTKLILNGNTELASDPQLPSLLQNNSGLTHLGLADIPLINMDQVLRDIYYLPLPLVELDISGTKQQDVYWLWEYNTLRKLNLANNLLYSTMGLGYLSTLRSLDINNNPLLMDIWTLASINSLQELYINGNTQLVHNPDLVAVLQNNIGLTHIGLADIPLNNPLQYLRDPIGAPYALQELNLSGTGLIDTYGITEYTDLTSLDISDNRIDNLMGMEALINLESLDLSNNIALQDLAPISNFTDLRQLFLNGNSRIAVTTGLDTLIRNNPGLTHLGLADIPMPYMIPLQDAYGQPLALIELDLSGTGLTDNFMLWEYITLERLNVANNNLSAIYGIDHLSNLISLDLSNNKGITNLSSIYYLSGLNEFYFNNNTQIDQFQLQDIFKNNSQIHSVGLANIPITDHAQLFRDINGQPLPLVSLDISGTGLKDTVWLSEYPKLEQLNLANNMISNTFGLEVANRIRSINLSDNPLLKDINSLANVTALTGFYFNNNGYFSNSPELENIIRNNNGLSHLELNNTPLSGIDEILRNEWGAPYPLVKLGLSGHNLFSTGLIGTFPALKSLDLSRNRIDTLTGIGGQAGLRYLDLSHNPLFVDAYTLTWLNNLQHLYLNGNSRITEDYSFKTVFVNNPGLTHIGLADIPITSIELATGFFPDPNAIVELDISGTGITDTGWLLEFSNIEKLNISNNRLTDTNGLENKQNLISLNASNNPDMQNIWSLPQLTNLRELYLNGNALLANSPELVATINNNPKLEHLELSGLPLADHAAIVHTGGGQPLPLTKLNLSNTILPNVSWIGSFPLMNDLDISNNPISDSLGMQVMQDLERLDISDTNITSLIGILPHNNIRSLKLNNNGNTDMLDLYSVINHNANLQDLGIAGLPVTSLYDLPLLNHLSGKPLPIQSLNISRTGISDITALAQFEYLRNLYASNDNIFDISSLHKFQLNELDLSLNNIVDLNGLETQRNIKQLDLTGNSSINVLQINTLLQNNGTITHLGLGNIPLDSTTFSILSDFYHGLHASVTELNVAYTGLQTVNDINQMRSLSSLDVSGNSIPDFSNLWSPLLKVLRANDMGLPDFGVYFPLLEELYLANNNLQYAGPFQPELKKLDLTSNGNNTFTNVFEFAWMQELVWLNLTANTQIACTDLDYLDQQLGAGIVIRPESCFSLPPNVSIAPHLDGMVVQSGEIINFSGVAWDPEDGDISDQLTWTSDKDGPIGEGGFFDRILSDGSHIITNTVTDSSGNTVSASANILVNTAPNLSITTPTEGQTLKEGDTIALVAQALDAEDGDISSNITWDNMGTPLGMGETISATLPSGNQTITAQVTDSHGAYIEQSVNVYVDYKPTITLDRTANGQTFTENAPIQFSATAFDTEDADLSSSIIWSSSIDGMLGQAMSINLPLSVGVHTITASVTDSIGNIAADSITVTINALPIVTISSPAEGQRIMAHEAVTFTATASDSEDGVISNNVVWTSSLDSNLGTGSPLSNQLSVGQHAITVTITDSHGATGSAQVNIVVDIINISAIRDNKTWVTTSWNNASTNVEIYANGVVVGTGLTSGSLSYKSKDPVAFKVCETGTQYCSADFSVQ